MATDRKHFAKADRQIVRLRCKRGRSGCYVFATLYGQDGNMAVVKPNGHKHVARVRLSDVRPLKARQYGLK